MNLTQFRVWVYKQDTKTLDQTFDELTAKLKRCRTPARRLGYALALDSLVMAKENLRLYGPLPKKLLTLDEILMSDDDLLREL
jgi:hypothetical protein